nr:UDP-glucuronosyltransferase 1-6 isoform X1 [Halyomorpha halys]
MVYGSFMSPPKMAVIPTILLLCFLAAPMEAANILILAPMPLYSHTYAFIAIFKELAIRGHNVTFVSPYPLKDPPPNWRDVEVELHLYSAQSIKDMVAAGGYGFPLTLVDFCETLMEKVFQDKLFMDFLEHDKTKYDVLLLESHFCVEPLIAISHKLNIPAITFQAMGHSTWYEFLTGGEVSFHLQPNMRSPYTNRMTFFQRLDNFFINLFDLCVNYYWYIPHQQALMDKYIRYPGYEKRPPLLDMLRNTSLTLMDYHFSVGYPEPLLPNAIPVGGLSAKVGAELTKEFQTIMDNAKEGVVYLNFGSVLRSTIIPEGMLETALSAMGELNYTVFMKWDQENIPNTPKNVLVRKWYPQPGILAHPNLRIFITHAGLHGITEAAGAGVPVLCVPFFADQEYNSRYAEQAGFGITLLRNEFTKENVVNSVVKIINDPRYKENAVTRSKILHDRPRSTYDDAMYWIEYVIRHKGAKHLRSARNDLSLYQFLGIDIALFLFSVVALPIFLLMVLFGRKKETKAKKD